MQALQIAENNQLINKTTRQFGHHKQLSFLSLQLDHISLEALHWALLSLKVDEMTPNERSIHSRIKEAFGFKIYN